MYDEYETPTSIKVIFWLIVVGLVFGIIAIFSSFYTIDAGERGIVLHWGAVTGKISDAGFHWINPITDSVVKMDVRIQKEEVAADSASSDLQTVSSKIALNYHINPTAVQSVYTETKLDYNVRLIQPAIQESVKAATSKFTAEELITKRMEVSQVMKSLLKDRLEPRGVAVDDVSIVNFDFSKSFNEAIEAKVTAEQQALAAKNKLEQVKYEAQQQVEAAKGKAEAINVEATALKDSPQVIELRSIEKWNGVLPQYVGGSTPVPFLDIAK